MSLTRFAQPHEVGRVRQGVRDRYERARLVADVSRLNALSMIAHAGSGHVGTSFSAMDIITWLWTEVLVDPAPDAAGRGDRYFSSKGHDAPGLYALLIGLGLLDAALLTRLRRLEGLPGHPDRTVPWMITNTGSLGMGISKARGLAAANRLNGTPGRIFVLMGDGELQEGQFWESLQPTANGGFSEINVIVDHNKIQSDTFVDAVSPLGDLVAKARAFGWAVERCDGHDPRAIEAALNRLANVDGHPHLLIADTVKGRGVSFMEGSAIRPGDRYRFHSGAPSDEQYEAAMSELRGRIDAGLSEAGLTPIALTEVVRPPRRAPERPQRLIAAYEDELASLGGDYPEVIVLDADLAIDCGTVKFRDNYPERYIECGIAEQDMVSQAGALALKGKIPIVHSFACFLSTRPNEQIYNNATDGAKVIYHASLAGLLPAGPGHSHQSVRDISSVGSIPGLTLIQPATELETRLALRWAVTENLGSTWLRLASVPWEVAFDLPADHKLVVGRGTLLSEGSDAVVLAYGPVMVSEAVRAADVLLARGKSVAVINQPWLNVIDDDWLASVVSDRGHLFVVEDHYVGLGQSATIAAALARLRLPIALHVFGVEGIPACGQDLEVLDHHGLTAPRLADRIWADM